MTQVPAAAQRARLKDGVHVELSPRRVRAYFDNQLLADSPKVLLVFETKRPPVYWFPTADVRMDLLALKEAAAGTASGTQRWRSNTGHRVADNIAWSYSEPSGDLAPLQSHIAFYWNAIDAWYEEDEEVFVHPRDPYTRVDTVHSSRKVRVEVEGMVIAETNRPVLLFETGLPTRYYIPKLDVRMDLLEPTETVTHCPYKGAASYWSLKPRHIRISSGAIPGRFPRFRRSRTCSASTTRRSTSTLTESCRTGRPRHSLNMLSQRTAS